MTEASHDKFVDRRTPDQQAAELATQILFWYDEEFCEMRGINRRRINGIAVTEDGFLLVARATCSEKDQFVKAKGRMIVARRMFGNAKEHNWRLVPYYAADNDSGALASGGPNANFDYSRMAEACANVYRDVFPNDEVGVKRAFNAGKVYAGWLANQQG